MRFLFFLALGSLFLFVVVTAFTRPRPRILPIREKSK